MANIIRISLKRKLFEKKTILIGEHYVERGGGGLVITSQKALCGKKSICKWVRIIVYFGVPDFIQLTRPCFDFSFFLLSPTGGQGWLPTTKLTFPSKGLSPPPPKKKNLRRNNRKTREICIAIGFARF